MGREEFTAPAESGREKRRKSVKQLLFVVASAYLGAFFGSILPSATNLDEVSWAIGTIVLLVLVIAPFVVDRYWGWIDDYLPD